MLLILDWHNYGGRYAAKYVEALLYGFCCGCISQPHYEHEEAKQALMLSH